MYHRHHGNNALLLLFSLFVALSFYPTVHGAPLFVTYGDNAECGVHCTLTANGGQTVGFGATTPCSSNVCDQWGTWGTSSALVVTLGDFLAFVATNFCISSVATKCDITAVSDSLGNVFTCPASDTSGTGQITSNPTIGGTACYDVATVAGTEPATNAFKITIACGACVIGDSWDTEYLVYEYNDYRTLGNFNYVNSNSGSVSTLNAAVTVAQSNAGIIGFGYAQTSQRPLTYGSGQTDKNQWDGNNGYLVGDLLGLGSHDFIINAAATGNIFQNFAVELDPLPPSTPSSGGSAGLPYSVYRDPYIVGSVIAVFALLGGTLLLSRGRKATT